MNTTSATTESAPSRAQAQRDRILCAARQCFIESGFHAASMATIAETAGMSAGLIYRYFDSKNAIILAIIEQQLREKRADIASLKPAADLTQKIGELFESWKSGDQRVMNPALSLEMTALATRDAQIAEALRNADRVSREDFSAWMRQSALQVGLELSESELAARAFALRCVIEGLTIRAVREPDATSTVVADALALLLPHLLPHHSTD
jgi:AcrR family transcriptional regulator